MEDFGCQPSRCFGSELVSVCHKVGDVSTGTAIEKGDGVLGVEAVYGDQLKTDGCKVCNALRTSRTELRPGNCAVKSPFSIFGGEQRRNKKDFAISTGAEDGVKDADGVKVLALNLQPCELWPFHRDASRTCDLY